jgi:hypothetical protein
MVDYIEEISSSVERLERANGKLRKRALQQNVVHYGKLRHSLPISFSSTELYVHLENEGLLHRWLTNIGKVHILVR